DAKMPANIAQKINVLQLCQPVGIVHNDGAIVAFESQVALQLCTQGLDILRSRGLRQHLAHFGPTTGIANHGCAPTADNQWSMASELHVRHGHDGEEATNMQAPGRRVIADVKGEAIAAKTLAQSIWMGDLLHKATCPQYIKDVFHKSYVSFLSLSCQES